MNSSPTPNPANSSPVRAASKHHPLMIAAAIAVILLCLTGTAAILGWLPSSIGGAAPKNELSDFDKATLASKMEQDGRQSAPALALAAPDTNALDTNALDVERRALNADRRDRIDADERAELNRNDAARERQRDAERDDAASAKRDSQRRVAQAAPEKAWCSTCGNVESVRAIKHRAEGSGLGAAGGAVLGGLLGNQIGGGHGRQLATVAGAVGGAVVGNQVEGNMKATTSYEIKVRLDNGNTRTFHQNSAPRWAAGDRVKVVKGALRSVG